MNNVFKFFGACAGLLLCFSVGFSFRDIAAGEKVSESAWSALIPFGGGAKVNPTELFKQHHGNILARYYQPIGKSELKYSAMQGMFGALGDPHTNFLEPRTAQEFSLETQGDFVGIGARLDDDPLGAKIVTVFKGSPAAAAGVEPGDVVVSVGPKEMAGIPTDEIVNFIRGEEGTVVELGLLRKGEKVTVRVRRARVAIPTAEAKMLDPLPVGYMAVTQFSETTPVQFREGLENLRSQGVQGLIIDMRGNPGGLLEAAEEMLANFVDSKLVLTMKGRGDEKKEYTPSGKVLDNLPIPVMILVNEDSASAAEIFAGVMSEYTKALLIGAHTYGKASVQNVIGLRDGASAKITTHRYYLPSGQDISRRVDEEGAYISGGLKPDIEVELKVNEDTRLGEPGKDSQLDRAIEELKSRMGLKEAAS